MIKVWKIFSAARYMEGVCLEHFDTSHMSIGHPNMVAVEDYLELVMTLKQIARHHGSAEQCREFAENALEEI